MSRFPGKQKNATRVAPSLSDATNTSHPPDPTFEHFACAARVDVARGLDRPKDIALASQVRSGCGGPRISHKWEIRDHRIGPDGFSEYFGAFALFLKGDDRCGSKPARWAEPSSSRSRCTMRLQKSQPAEAAT